MSVKSNIYSRVACALMGTVNGRPALRNTIGITLALALVLARGVESDANATLVRYEEQSAWTAATSGITTIGSDQIPYEGYITDQLAPYGVSLAVGTLYGVDLPSPDWDMLSANWGLPLDAIVIIQTWQVFELHFEPASISWTPKLARMWTCTRMMDTRLHPYPTRAAASNASGLT